MPLRRAAQSTTSQQTCAVPSPPIVSVNRAAITEHARIAELLRAIYGYEGQPVTMCALKLAPLTFVRPRELRAAEWSEFDLDAASKDEMTGHGFRALASTCLNEQGWHPDLIELQLAHAERNKVRAAYNRAQRLSERRQMMQAWADHLDALRTGANVLPLKLNSANARHG